MKKGKVDEQTTYHWIPAFYTTKPQKGGELRSSQIGDFLNCKSPFIHQYILSKYQIIFYSLLRFLSHFQLPSRKLKNINQFACNYKAWLSIKKDKEANIVVFWETTKDFEFAYLLRKLSASTKAFPHNVESLANNIDSTLAQRLFVKEVKALKCVHELNVISAYDKSIFEKAGLKARLMPFQISSIAKNELDLAKNAQTQKRKNNFVILGTATNPPTKKGLDLLIAMLQILPANDFNFEFIGIGMQTISAENRLKNSISLDSISNADLFKKLTSCTGAIIYQPKTTGFLTRITMLQYLDVPILLNKEYAQLHPDLENIMCYQNVDELFKGLKQISAILLGCGLWKENS